jgi:hypothetical protein
MPGVFSSPAEDVMSHKFSIGQRVYFEPKFGNAAAATGAYEVIRLVPLENDNRLCYRIKNLSESFERIVEEHQLSHDD